MAKYKKRDKERQGRTISTKSQRNETAMNAFLGLIAFILIMMASTSCAHASSFIEILSTSPPPDTRGFWVMLALAILFFIWNRSEMSKDTPRFDEDGYLIEEGGQDVR